MAKLNLILNKDLGICVIFNLKYIKRARMSYLKSFSVRIVICALLFSFIQGCATAPRQALQNVSNIEQVSHWQARGKLLIKNSQDKLSGYFFWQQQGEHDFKLVITSFIGTSLMTLDYQNQLARIQIDGKSYTETNPERLLYRLTGNYIPVRHMAKWMLGQAPEDATKQNQGQQLQSFIYHDAGNNDWQVNYQSYQAVSQLNLPQKMTIQGLDSRIKLTINDWELLAP